MDSGNSGGSIQSSSGGEEEHDSRVGSTPSLQFFNHPGHFASISNPNQSPTFFDPSFHNLPSFSQSNPNPNPNPPYNPDLLWSRAAPRSDPNITGSSSSSQALLGPQRPISGSLRPTGLVTEQSVSNTNTVKSSKKRTRASRRAPTTVLTTDTSNFRQMVQEFTGVPASPFSGSPYSRRFDLFAPGSTMRSGPLEPLRPSVLKAQPMPFVNTSLNTTSFLGTFNSSTNNNYQIGSDLGLVIPKQGTNLPNMENPNPNLTFQSHYNPNLKYPSNNNPIFGSNSQENSRIPSIDELGIGHENLNPSFGGFQGGGNSYQNQSRGDQEHLGSFKGDSDHVSSSKLKYCSVSTSDLQPEKGLENVSSRGEGTVDSWICPSE